MDATTLAPEQKKALLSLDPDHEGNAQSVLVMYPGKFHYNITHGWLKWNGKYWERNGAEGAAERAVTNVLKIRRVVGAEFDKSEIIKCSRGWRSNIVGTRDQLRKCKELEVSIDEFDNSPDLINCKNGVLDLRTGELHPHDSKYKFTYCLPVDYDQTAVSEEWEAFLSSALSENEEMLRYLQLSVGYSLTGHTREEMMFYVFGPSRSGKGTFTEAIISLMGWPMSVEVDFETFTANRYGDTNNFDLAPLKPCRFVAASESNRYGSLNPAKIKQLTGGNYIRCSFKRQEHFSYRPQYKIWLSSNHPVNIDADDDAAWGRVRVINFPNSHLGEEDKGLKERLKSPTNLRGILAWAVRGAMAWYESSLPTPETVKQETARHRDELDYLQTYISERCVISDGAYVSNSDLYNDYKRWCDDEGYKPKFQRQFSMSLKTKGFEAKPKRVGGHVSRHVDGLGLLSDQVLEFSRNGKH
jgi:putative DNA primase/helicase